MAPKTAQQHLKGEMTIDVFRGIVHTMGHACARFRLDPACRNQVGAIDS
jgi:hypothetical protein